MSTVWLGLGSNLGDRREHIRRARTALDTLLSDIVSAPCYETAPMDYLDQSDFLNTVIRGRTRLPPTELLAALLSIEADAGRTRSALQPKGPRVIDIDILLYDDAVISTADAGGSGLIIPHPRMARRLFVLKPLLDLDPRIVDPSDGVMWSLKASSLSDQKVKLYGE